MTSPSPTLSDCSSPTASNMNPSTSDLKGFGTPIQQFVQKLNAVLAKYHLDTKLSDGNFPDWSLGIKQVLKSIDYYKYLKKIDYKAEGLTDEQHLKVKLVITIWMLNLMDHENKNRCQTMLRLRRERSEDEDDSDTEREDDSDDEDDMVYEPPMIYKYLRNHHNKISESGLQAIDDAINEMKIHSSDSFKSHCDKFNNLMADHHLFKGKMTSSQAARKLIKSVRNRISETTSELIHSQVKPLTREGVVQYLIDYENCNGGFITQSMKVANYTSLDTTQTQPESNAIEQAKRKPKCTEHKCISQTHSPDECFAKPKNFGARDKWIAEMDAKRRNGTFRNFKPSSSNVSGMKRISLPSSLSSANATFASFHVTYSVKENCSPETDRRETDRDYTVEEQVDDDNISIDLSGEPRGDCDEIIIPPTVMYPQVALHNVFSEGSSAANLVKSSDDWALFDTGSSDHVFKSELFFDASSIRPVDDKNHRLNLAGGGASLAVKSRGTAKLQSGSGKPFELAKSLCVPELAQNLLAGGLMLRKGITILINQEDPNCFSLVYKNEALFNGIFTPNNLMFVTLESVSHFSGHQFNTTEVELMNLQHRRLGHISKRYLKSMIKHGSAEGPERGLDELKHCTICSLSKSHKLPHSGSRPRAKRPLENVHVDLSGIIRVKGISG